MRFLVSLLCFFVTTVYAPACLASPATHACCEADSGYEQTIAQSDGSMNHDCCHIVPGTSRLDTLTAASQDVMPFIGTVSPSYNDFNTVSYRVALAPGLAYLPDEQGRHKRLCVWRS